ncbi:hypothetical protein L1276_000528 [Flavobacterium sp. HSC-32F16]|nr:hypothetical protein [Flavobacterium sp. HSC-32F16]
MINDLKDLMSSLDDEFGGDIGFIKPCDINLVDKAEKQLGFQFPTVFKQLYHEESNGLRIDNKIIYSIYDEKEKKTFSENLQRINNPETSYWFKFKPEIFNDYLIIGSDGEICFAIYRHRELDNPTIYICENPNAKKDVILEKLDFGLADLIKVMVDNAFN